MLFSEELMHLTLFYAHGSYGKGFLPLLNVRWLCSVFYRHPLYVGKQLSGTDIQNQLLLGLEPLGFAGVFLDYPQDLCLISLSEKHRPGSMLSCLVEVCASCARMFGLLNPNCLTFTSGE